MGCIGLSPCCLDKVEHLQYFSAWWTPYWEEQDHLLACTWTTVWSTLRTGIKHLKEILCQLCEPNLTVKIKCVFTAQDCVYLWYKIGCRGVKPEENKIHVWAVIEMPRPKTKKDVRTWLASIIDGLFNTMQQLLNHRQKLLRRTNLI